jgi:quercetin dioxygenase-like cupin family protein
LKIVKVHNVPKTALASPIFTGGEVTQQTILTETMSRFFNIALVTFAPGARNKLHTHSTEQVLFVTAGQGIVATEKEQVTVSPGDVIHFAAGEKHWHGATAGSGFAHIYITGVDNQTTKVEP